MTSYNNLPFSLRGDALIGQEMFKVLDNAKKLELEGKKVFHLELGSPRMSPPNEIFQETLKALENKLTGYTSSSGLIELREEIARHHSLNLNRTISSEQVVISPANLLVSQFMDLVCNRGDRIVLFSPFFPTYLAASSYVGLNVKDIPLSVENGFDLTIDAVDKAIATKPRAIIVNSANNPTGRVYSQNVLEHLASECNKNRIWLLSDETYANITFGRSFFSLAQLDYPQLLVISSFSKVFSIPGFRTGYVIANNKVAEKLTLSNSTLFSCSPAFTQLGCLAGLRQIKEYGEKIKLHYKNTSKEISEIIRRCSLLEIVDPDSAFYLFIDISSTGLKDTDFCDLLLSQKHTAATPGSSFGIQFSNFVRIAICGSIEDVKEGVNRFVEFVEEQATKI